MLLIRLVGFFNANGDGKFAVSIRCAEFDASQTTARLFAGGGIVADGRAGGHIQGAGQHAVIGRLHGLDQHASHPSGGTGDGNLVSVLGSHDGNE